MPARRIDVFFYGLFMDAALLRTKGVYPTDIRPASLKDFALRIGARATLVRKRGACAYGMLMELTYAEIGHLYSEKSVSAYRPEAVCAEAVDGSRVAALCFTLPEPDRKEANPEYTSKLRDLALRLKLPPDYIEKIR